jgi:hypothetical protein
MQSAIAILAVGLVLACVASLAYLYRHHKLAQAAVGQDGAPASRD